VANPLPLYSTPSDDLIWGAGLSMTNEDAEYPVENAQGAAPVPAARSTTNTTTITITTASALPVYLALHNTNAETGTFNGHTITFPGVDAEGQRIGPRLDLRTLIFAAGTSWTLVLSRASGDVWVGRISLVTVVYELNVKQGTWAVGRRRPADITIETRGGHVLKHSYGVRTRLAKGTVDLIEDEADISGMDLKANGSVLPFLLVPDEATNDAWFVRQTTEYAKAYPDFDVRATSLTFEELSSGPPNG
jgi:hypothetical protein